MALAQIVEPDQGAASRAQWERRFTACADSIDGHHAAWEDEIEARNRLIVQAFDLGWNRSQVARWARVSPTRVTQVVAHWCAE